MVFIDNKYTKIYLSLVESRKTLIRHPEEYIERHHIVPKCLGGSDEDYNLVSLSAREHFIAHMLLIRMTESTDQNRLRFALMRMMSNPFSKKLSSKYYEIARLENRKALSCKIVTEATRKKMSAWQKGIPKSDATKQKLSDFAKTRTGSKNSFYGKSHTPETIKQINESKKGQFYITNGIIDKKVKHEEDIPNGWKRGRSKGKNAFTEKRQCDACQNLFSIANFGRHICH